MKKNLFYVLALAAMTSCSQDEVMEMASKEAISFKEAFVENTVRSIDGTYSNSNKPTSFLVYGNTRDNVDNASIVPIFEGVTVSSTNTTDGAVGEDYKYNAEYTQYWIPGNTYNFAAVVNGTVADADIINGFPTKISYDATDQKDLLFATKLGVVGKAKGSNDKVSFVFDHLLAKAYFTVKNTMTDNTAERMYTYRVSNVCINNAALAAECPCGLPSINWDPATSFYTKESPLSFGNVTNGTSEEAVLIGKVDEEDEATSHYQRVLIPATYGSDNKLNITCKIETLLNGAVVDVENYEKNIEQTFSAGKVYNFVLNIGAPGDKIMFTVGTINDWVEDGTHDSNEDSKNDYTPLK